jgi:hypothetical protein
MLYILSIPLYSRKIVLGKILALHVRNSYVTAS